MKVWCEIGGTAGDRRYVNAMNVDGILWILAVMERFSVMESSGKRESERR